MSYMFDDDNTDITMLRRKIEEMQTELDSQPVQIPGLNSVAAVDTIPISPKEGSGSATVTLDSITTALGDSWTQIEDVLAQFTFDANNLVSGIQDALDSAVDSLIAGIGQLGSDVSTWITDLHTNAATTITDFFADVGGSIETALGDAWTNLTTFIGSITTTAGTWLEGQGTAIQTALGTAWTNLTTFLGSITEAAGTWLEGQAATIETALGTAWTNLETFIGNITESAADWLAARGTEIETALGTAWTNISTFVGSITSTAAAWLEARGTEIQTALGTSWTNLTTFLGSITSTATVWLESAGTQIESALGSAYTWLKAKYTDAENTIDQIVMWFGSGTDQIASGVNTFLDAAKSVLFGGLIPSAFAEGEADGQITASLASGGDIKTEIGADIKGAFDMFAADLSSTITTIGTDLATLLSNIGTFLTGTTQTGANVALSNLGTVSINKPLTFASSLNNTGTNDSTGIGKNTDGDMYFKVPEEEQFYWQSNGETIFEAVMDSSTSGYLKLRGNTTDPSPGEGGIWYNTTDNKFKFKEGSSTVGLGGELTTGIFDDFFDDSLTSINASGIDFDSDYFMVQDTSNSTNPVRKVTAYDAVGSVFRQADTFGDTDTTAYAYQFAFDVDNGSDGLTSDGTAIYTSYLSIDKYNTSGQEVSYTAPSSFSINSGFTVYDNKFYGIVIAGIGDRFLSRAIDGSGSTSTIINNSTFDDFEFRDVVYGNNRFWFINFDSSTVRAYTTAGVRAASDDFDLPFNPRGIDFYDSKLWFINNGGLRQIRAFSTSGTESTSDAIDLVNPEEDASRTYVCLTVFDDGIAVGYSSSSSGSTFFDKIQWYEEETTTASNLNTSDVILVQDATNNAVKQATIGGITSLIDTTGGLSEDTFDSFMDDLSSYSVAITPDVEIVVRGSTDIRTVTFENVLGGAFTHSDIPLDGGTDVDDGDYLLYWNRSGTNTGLNRIAIEDLPGGGGSGSLTQSGLAELMADLPAVTTSTYSAQHDTLLLRLSGTTLGEESLQAILLELMDEVTESTAGVTSDRIMLANSSLTSFKTIPLSSITEGDTTTAITSSSWNDLASNFSTVTGLGILGGDVLLYQGGITVRMSASDFIDDADIITEDRMESFVDDLDELSPTAMHGDEDHLIIVDESSSDVRKMSPNDIHRGLINDVTTNTTPSSSDTVVFLNSSGNLRKCTIAQFVAAGTA